MSHPFVVVGVCVPERRGYAQRLAAATGSRLVSPPEEQSPPVGPVPVDVVRSRAEAGDLVIDVATSTDVVHLHPVRKQPSARVVCVVDARHMIDDLREGTPLLDAAAPGDDRGDVGARARQAVRFIEIASLICFVGWEQVDTARLSMLMALASHLNPHARVRLSRDVNDDVRALTTAATGQQEVLERAGWVSALNDEHDPYMTDRRVSTIRFEQLRPFHPGRLVHALDLVDSGRIGVVLRSAGFCRLATRPHILARWEQVGSAMWIDPLTSRMDAGSTSQDIALTGLDLNRPALLAALESAIVTDAELAAGPPAWRRFADPLPAWNPHTEDAEHDLR